MILTLVSSISTFFHIFNSSIHFSQNISKFPSFSFFLKDCILSLLVKFVCVILFEYFILLEGESIETQLGLAIFEALIQIYFGIHTKIAFGEGGIDSFFLRASVGFDGI